MGPSRTNRPAAMVRATSAICCISSRWLDTNTVLPSDGRSDDAARASTVRPGSAVGR